MGKDVGCIASRYDLARQEKWRRDASATAGSSAKGKRSTIGVLVAADVEDYAVAYDACAGEQSFHISPSKVAPPE
jgi:hypothetical protein